MMDNSESPPIIEFLQRFYCHVGRRARGQRSWMNDEWMILSQPDRNSATVHLHWTPLAVGWGIILGFQAQNIIYKCFFSFDIPNKLENTPSFIAKSPHLFLSSSLIAKQYLL